MIRYIIRRIVLGALVLLAVMSLSFFMMRLAPGGPFDQDKKLPEQVQKNLEEKFGLNKSLSQQYFSAMKNYVQLDFGVCISAPSYTVREKISEHYPYSLELGLYAMIVALVLGIGAGLIAGSKPNSMRDYTVMSGAMIGVSVPSIVLGPLLLLIFASWLGWVPYGGWDDSWRCKVLPSVTLGLVYAAYFARLTRGGMLEIIRQDYIRTAHAKGLPSHLVMRRHALKGGILPSVTFMGPAMAGIFTGSVVVEQIFSVPGISNFFVQGALSRDYHIAMGVLVLYSGLLISLNIIVDIGYTFLDPRVRLG
jgi:oligopeptide transport system permease protein